MDGAFKAGLAEAGWPGTVLDPPVELKGQYDDGDGGSGKHDELYKEMGKADGDKTVEVIVAVGGLVCAHAAQTIIKQTPFLILIGQFPKFKLDNDKYCGGVNLDMSGQNIARHDFLVGHYGVAPDKVCLIWNSNSKMGKFEKKEWNRRKWRDEEIKTNSDAGIQTAFANAAMNCGGVVISGDPFFTSSMNVVVQEANKAASSASKMKICYPFSVYANATTGPLQKQNSMIYGPDLEAAYRMLGRKAGAILDNKADPPDTGLDPCPTTGPIFVGG